MPRLLKSLTSYPVNPSRCLPRRCQSVCSHDDDVEAKGIQIWGQVSMKVSKEEYFFLENTHEMKVSRLLIFQPTNNRQNDRCWHLLLIDGHYN